MHAIIRQGNGKYYISSVFGYYSDVKSEDDYQRYLERIHSTYYVVFNEEKTKLIKWFNIQPDTEYLIKQVLIIDFDESGWIINEQDDTGGVEFLPRELADKPDSIGSEGGTIIADEEYKESCRITLERCERYDAITCGVYGSMMHTTFCDKSHSQEVFDNMKRDLQEFIDKDTTAEEEDIFYEEFTSKY